MLKPVDSEAIFDHFPLFNILAILAHGKFMAVSHSNGIKYPIGSAT